jgi:hypothetical protein
LCQTLRKFLEKYEIESKDYGPVLKATSCTVDELTDIYYRLNKIDSNLGQLIEKSKMYSEPPPSIRKKIKAYLPAEQFSLQFRIIRRIETQDEILNKIDTAFKQNKLVIIQGISGLGKSTFAYYFAEERKKLYLTRWIDCSSGYDVEQSLLLELQRILDCITASLDEAISQLYELISKDQQTTYLFVFDDLRDYETIKPFLKCSPLNFKVLITTARILEELNKFNNFTLQLTGFIRSETKDYLKSSIALIQSEKDLERVCECLHTNEEVNGLRIRLLSSMIRDKEIGLDLDNILGYIKNKSNQEWIREILSRSGISSDKLAYRTLNTLSYLGNAVEYDLIKSLVHQCNRLREQDLQDCLKELKSKSLITYGTNEKLVFVHDEISSGIRRHYSDSKEHREELNRLVAGLNQLCCYSLSFSRYYKNILRLIENFELEKDIDSEDYLQLLKKWAIYQKNRCTNLKLYKEILDKLYSRTSKFESLHIDTIFMLVEYYAHDMSDRQSANVYLAEIDKLTVNDCKVYADIAGFYKNKLGDIKGAEKYYIKALDFGGNIGKDPDFIRSLNQVARYYRSENIDKSNEIYSRVDGLVRSSLARHVSLNELAEYYRKILNDIERVCDIYEQILKDAETTDIDRINVTLKLALLYKNTLKNKDKALEYLNKVKHSERTANMNEEFGRM